MNTTQPYKISLSALKAAFLGLLCLLAPATFLGAGGDILTDVTLQQKPQQNWGILSSIYNEGYQPPSTIGKCYIKSDDFNTDCEGVQVYATEGMSNELLQRLLTEREPVNISFENRPYNDTKLKKEFGYNRSAYYDLWGESQKKNGTSFSPIALNIAVLTPTRFFKRPYGDEFHYNVQEDKEILILNVIGAAFDHPQQPDTLHFLKKDGNSHTITAEKSEELMLFMISVFDKIFTCVEEKRVENLYLAGFGTGAFAGLFPGGREAVKKIWLQAFKHSLLRAKKEQKLGKLASMSFLGGALASYQENALTFCSSQLPNIKCNLEKSYKIDTQNLSILPEKEEGETLFINAWDCHSMLGNGNQADHSLDGYFGRLTGMAAVGWPCTNKCLVSKKLRSHTTLVPKPKLSESSWMVIGGCLVVVIVAIASVFFFAWQRQPKKRRKKIHNRRRPTKHESHGKRRP